MSVVAHTDEKACRYHDTLTQEYASRKLLQNLQRSKKLFTIFSFYKKVAAAPAVG
jgi:hypothetical protein